MPKITMPARVGRQSGSDVLYDTFKWIIMVGFALACLLPMLHLLGVSLAPYREIALNPYLLWPKRPTLHLRKL